MVFYRYLLLVQSAEYVATEICQFFEPVLSHSILVSYISAGVIATCHSCHVHLLMV
jgi:hypothetical protein